MKIKKGFVLRVVGGENVVVPLDTLMYDEKYGFGGSELKFDSPSVDEIIPKFLNEGKIDGVQYALPFMRSTEACYVNKDLLESLGFTLPETLTWDFVFEVSEYALSLGKDEDGNYLANGQKTLIPFIYKSTDNMMISMLKQLEAPYSTANGEILLFNDTTKDILLEISKHAKTKAFSTFKISSYPGNFLNAGQCIFAIDSTAGATWMGADAPLVDIPDDQRIDFETAVMPIPQFDEENPQMISQGPSLCIFNKEDSGEVLAYTDNGNPLVCRYTVGDGEVILFNVNAYPAHPAIQGLYENILKEMQAQAVANESVWVEADESVQFAVYNQDDSAKHVYILAVDWYREPSYLRTCALRIAGKAYSIQIPFGIMYKCVIKNNVGAYCHSEKGEVLAITDKYIRVQGIGKQTFSLLKDGKMKVVEVDFSQASIVEISINE